jgi:hypothetical protein
MTFYSVFTSYESAILIIVSGAIMAGSIHVAEFIVFRFFSGAASYMLVAAPPAGCRPVAALPFI